MSVSEITDIPRSELNKTNLNAEVRDEKPPDPTMDMLLPATNNNETKSVGVGPLSLVIADREIGVENERGAERQQECPEED